MQNLANKLNALVIDFLNLWIHYLDKFWPIVGVIFGFCISLAWLNRNNKTCGFFTSIAMLALLFQLGFYFAIPHVALHFTAVEFHLPAFYLWSFIGEALLGVVIVWLIIRYGSPYIEVIKHRLTKTSSVERNRKTDIRQIGVHLPNAQNAYAPEKYFNLKRGIFFGLNEHKQPVYIPLDKWRKTHLDIIGTTGSGKGVAAGVMLTQALSSGECVIVVDPKNDEFLPHVMLKAAQEAGVPYVYIDLLAEATQWNPLQHKNANEIEELLSAGFSLGEKGTDADFYRLDDRRAARIFANLAYSNQTTLINTLQLLIEQQPDIAEAGKKFISDLEEIGLVSAVNTTQGVDLAKLMQQGAVIYVRGSMRNPRILKLQRIFVLSMIQHIEVRERESARHVCLFMDEFKYLISRPSLEALGAIRDKRAHVIIAHQSLGDLRDCPADLDADSVVASVNENCAIKLAYMVKDPNTADWLARMSGLILVDDEIRQVKTNAGLTETRNGERTLRQADRNLIDTNMLQALPERCAVLFGAGLAKFFFTSPILVNKSTKAITPIAIKQPSKPTDAGRKINNAALTTAQSMLDVD
ncbi:MAG TPA: type IV secretory system conjugative DNA transfer family protein [Methylotenera sp.]|nr:type IV secretory system conjugative DNA transfer family protein [Methylotenera sp.]